MSDRSNDVLSRRQWVGLASVPVIAAAMGSGLLARRAVGAPERAEVDGDPKLLGARIYNVRDFGAKGDGATLDTEPVQAAIDQCNKDKGGTVLIPAGDFLVGTLTLKSNITLHLATQGRLLGSPKIDDYHPGDGIPRSNGNIVLLSGSELENVTIEGRGTIDGNGAKFYTGKGDGSGPSTNPNREPGYTRRPHLIVFYKCRNVLVRDVFLTASAYHCCRLLQCRFVRLEGVHIHNRVNKNNDGFHINSSEYVNIVNCNIACQDDACALFGSNKFVTVTNSSFSTRWSVFRFGGGEPENITISNCLIYETYGCPIKMRFDRRSRAENISFSNLVLRDVTGPISIGLGASRRRPSSTQSATEPTAMLAAATEPASAPTSEPTTGTAGTLPRGVRNISFNGIRATVVAKGRQHADLPFESAFREGEVRTCITLNSVAEIPLENISFTDVHVTYEGGGTTKDAHREMPKIAGEYFEVGTPNAYGIYARNVAGLTLHNVRLEVSNRDVRPAVVFDHVRDASVNGLSAQGNEDAAALLRFIDSKEVLLSATRVLTPAAAFLQVEGENSENITVDGGQLAKAAKPLALAHGASEDAVKLRI